MNLYPSEIMAAYRVALSRDQLLEAQRAADTLKRLGFIAEAKEIYKKIEKQALQYGRALIMLAATTETT